MTWVARIGAVLAVLVALEGLGLRPVVMAQWREVQSFMDATRCEQCVRWCLDDGTRDTPEACFELCQQRGQCPAKK